MEVGAMITKMPKTIPQSLKSAVSAYLVSRGFAETVREKVDQIDRAILAECPLKLAPRWKERGTNLPELITEPKYTYLCDDSDQLADFYQERHNRQRQQGIKPESMPFEHCPALVAEHNLVKCEHLVIEAAAQMLGEKLFTPQKLICAGLDKYQQFIDLSVRLVVNLPDFKSPLAITT
jgi:hypothetical protein